MGDSITRYLLASLLALTALVGCSSQTPEENQSKQPANAHAGHKMDAADSTLLVENDPSPPIAGAPTHLKLMIHDAKNKMVREFDETHERKMHLIVVREGLDEFAHVHPEISAEGLITISHTFPVPGRYLLYTDHKPRGGSPATPMASVDVSGDPPAAPELKPDVPGTIVADLFQAKIEVTNAQAGAETPIAFELFDKGGQPLNDLEPYLGAMGHLVVLSADGKQFVHAHPNEGTPKSNRVTFGAHFPSIGTYKGWGQFQRAGAVHTIPFVVEVK